MTDEVSDISRWIRSMVGRTISHYRIIEKLGEGGMGVVYRAEDLRLHRIVALKFPSEPFARDDEMKTRFMNEARMSASLIHQNVAVTYDVGEYDGKPFIAMEFVDGPTIRDIIAEQGPFPIEQFVDIALQIAEGLGAVHEAHVLHRDIKSANVLLSSKTKAKIADCGLAARFVHAEGLGERLGIAGTTAYMSPEQIRGDALDQRSDLFSLGVLFYEMVTGRLPFQADHPAVLMYLIANSPPPPVETFRPDAPANIVSVIARLLEKDLSRRYQSVAEVAEDLRRARASLASGRGRPTR